MESTQIKEGESVNGLFRNKVRVIQAIRGYRVSEDALILAWFVRPRPNDFVLDAGAGCGAIAFGLAVKETSLTAIGLEIQEALCDRARRGVELNGLRSRVSIVRGDVRNAHRFFRAGCFDVVACNPPYHEPGRGRTNPHEEKALARHQLMMPLSDLFRASNILLKPGGRLTLIYPAGRLDRIRQAMKENGFEPARMLWIHPRQGVCPGLVCVEAGSGKSTHPLIEDSLFLYDESEARTREAEAILAGEDI